MPTLNLTQIVNHRLCPKRVWLHQKAPHLAQTEDLLRPRLLEQLYSYLTQTYVNPWLPSQELEPASRLTATTQALHSTISSAYVRPFLHAHGVYVEAGILVPLKKGYQLLWPRAATRLKPRYIEEAAIAAWLATQMGLTIESVHVVTLNKRFHHQGVGRNSHLLKPVVVDLPMQGVLPQVQGWIEACHATLQQEVAPQQSMGSHCHRQHCPFLNHCSPALCADDHPIRWLSRAPDLVKGLEQQGYADLKQVPMNLLQKRHHQRMARVARSGYAELDERVAKILQALPYPRYFVDFETVSFAVPPWDGVNPIISQVPFQWSCHIQQADGELHHLGFLAPPGEDPRRRFSETLLHAIGDEGPIFVYNASFEKGRMQEMAQRFSDLADALKAAQKRVVDLHPLARDHYYHPAMQGSWSLKAVLPTLGKGLSYTNLTIADGEQAQARYLSWMFDPLEEAQALQIQLDLECYCQLDTLALVMMVERFEQGLEAR
ncbi:conserved hypothetical protein [Magnetococcus marinus MC-1]|uniref:DUF2779 domain-containing protein n=1 Tax=Magnetococcus marinus (strain ATCC BAA-1437 / JCM 17883 / MC-1) TaxID=156889 RepID=A0L8P2_MAGMM|nr:DUF2779 domain-containing protein [Magnetococcus marinus]ABK44335.1 conserved hypothetical protein [Magnetococcus marinus MC-1]